MVIRWRGRLCVKDKLYFMELESEELMKRLKSSGFLKLIAWVAFILSLNIFVVSMVAMAFMADLGFYHKSYTEVRTSMLGQVNQNYSAQALAYMGRDMEEYFAERDFEYGIVKADNWEEGSTNDPAVYEECNFDPTLLESEECYLYVDYISKDTVLCNQKDMWGDTIYYLDTPYVSETKGHYAEKIVYDEYTGVIYYLSGGEYYPAKKIQINFIYQNEPMIFIYEYQFGKNNYLLKNMWATYADGNSHSYRMVNIPDEAEETAKELISGVLACDADDGMGSEFDFTMLEDVGCSIYNIGDIILDNVRVTETAELEQIDSSALPEFEIHQKDNYYLNEYYTLMVTEHDEAEKYIVVSRIPESFDSDTDQSQYAVVNQRFQVAYEWRYLVFVVMGISALIAVCSFVFLMKAAGHRKKEEELVLGFFDKIPFEICAGAIFCAEGMGIACISDNFYLEASELIWILTVMIVLAMEIFAMLFLLSVAVRVKTKTLWKNTIIYRICHVVAEAIRYFIRNISFVWKAVVGFVVVDGLLMFFVFVLACNSYSEEIFFICLLIDAVIAVIYFVVIVQMNQLQEASKKLAQGNLDYETDTSKMFWEFKKHGDNLNKIGNGISLAVEERMKSEHFKTELITNVSHDIKTPLTSIINYVDLLGKEDLQNENASEYIEVLQRQSSKLKKLIEDLVEASKASTGNLAVNMETLEAGVFLTQTVGEFEEKFAANGLELIIHKPEEPVYIRADGRHLWRVVDNLMNNILKYAQPLSRVYVHLEEFGSQVTLTFRNMSKDPLNLTGEELKERFIRGDKSRNSEGHGLGLAIAQSLMDLMKAELTIHVDGDLFKVILTFAKREEEA
ncbi:MAG: HAMP domain-containing histidine kinase [Lachnospiraceae bacterium]|nr:HAMP domain-containing histidine kinase [Lachnospiraceae bacterium]